MRSGTLRPVPLILSPRGGLLDMGSHLGEPRFDGLIEIASDVVGADANRVLNGPVIAAAMADHRDAVEPKEGRAAILAIVVTSPDLLHDGIEARGQIGAFDFDFMLDGLENAVCKAFS